MKYVDLSYDIKNEMPVYPGDIELHSNKEKDYEKDGFNLYSFFTSMHAGTHIDARGEKVIGIKEEYYRNIKENDIVLLFTGWDSFYGKKEYYTNHPIISEEFAELLIKKKIKMLGIDMPSPDNGEFKIHKKLFENDIFILENLTNLNKLLYSEEIQIFAQPLKIQGEASLVRAIAVYNGY